MKIKRPALYSPVAMAAYFLGRAETHRLNSRYETRDQFRQGARAMMRDNALRAVHYIKQIGGVS
jgi:hypothetical protein